MFHPLQEYVVNLIPSRDLRKAIRDSGYRCADLTLLALAFQCASDFESRIRHLQLLRDSFSGEMRAYADSLITTQRQILETFLESGDGIVFELRIKETPDAWEECYLCTSYAAAVRMIALFYQEYEGQENPSSRYCIVKRRILSGESFAEDCIGTALLLPGPILHSVELVDHIDEEHPELCAECEDEGEAYHQEHCPGCLNSSVATYTAAFPCFLTDLDVVEYRGARGLKTYGIVRQYDNAPVSSYYIIPLDTEDMRCHKFTNIHWTHQHIPAQYVERSTPDMLPAPMQTDRLAYLAYLREQQGDSV